MTDEQFRSTVVSPATIRKLASIAHIAVEASADRTLAQADLAGSYCSVAADWLESGGDYDVAMQLLQRAGQVCEGYSSVRPEAGK